jgi:hypothetical protein
MSADMLTGYIAGLFNGEAFNISAHSLDRSSRRVAVAQFLHNARTEFSNDKIVIHCKAVI